MAARKSTVQPIQVTHTLAKAKPASCGEAFAVLVATFGAKVAATYASEGCKRLPRHEVTAEKGHKAEKPMGLLTPKQREARKAANRSAKPKASKAAKPKVVTVGGAKYTSVTKADGSIVLTPVTPVDQPKAVAVAARIVELPMADSPRRVAASSKTTKRRNAPKTSQPESATPNRVVRQRLSQPKAAAAQA